MARRSGPKLPGAKQSKVKLSTVERQYLEKQDAHVSYEIEKIIRHKDDPPAKDPKTGKMLRARKYFIKWKGWDTKWNTWEPFATINSDAPEVVEDYEEDIRRKKLEAVRKKMKKQRKLEERDNMKPVQSRLDPQSELKRKHSSTSSMDDHSSVDGDFHRDSIIPKRSRNGSESSLSDEELLGEKNTLFREDSVESEVNTLEIDDVDLTRYRIYKVERPGANGDGRYVEFDLVYTLQNPTKREDCVKLRSSKLQQTEEGRDMLCQWLERFMQPFMTDEKKYMKSIKSQLQRLPLAGEQGEP